MTQVGRWCAGWRCLRAPAGGAQYWAVIASLIETRKMNSLVSQAILRDAPGRIRHPMSRIDDLLPFANMPARAEKTTA
jgi:hypothetical protein